jgi:hypothetical protein
MHDEGMGVSLSSAREAREIFTEVHVSLAALARSWDIGAAGSLGLGLPTLVVLH